MSAFLKYSQMRRGIVKEKNPDMSNTDVSRLLGEMWRNASPTEKAPYVEQEEGERAAYKQEIKRWREGQAKADVASRANHTRVGKMQAEAPVYESFLDPFEYKPVCIHTIDEATKKADERPFPSFALFKSNAENSPQRLFPTYDTRPSYHPASYRYQPFFQPISSRHGK
jgi:hypothetical protein